MNNSLHILQTLDRHLTKPSEITIFGRAALALGFQDSPAAFATTHDVDRPSALDLILSKMARGTCARVPDVPEIRELFQIAQPKVLAMLSPDG